MKLRTRLTLAALTCAFLLPSPLAAQCPGVAGAVCKYFQVESGNWNDPLNWDDSFGSSPGTTPVFPEHGIVGDGATFFLTEQTAEINSELTNPEIGDMRVGQGPGGIGVLNHSAGTLTSGFEQWSFLGADGIPDGGESSGTYNLSGTAVFESYIGEFGMVDAGAEFHMGFGGGGGGGTPGNVGTLNLSDTASFTTNRMFVGSNDGNVGNNVTQSGGSLYVDDWLVLGRDTGATGTYNLSGGSLIVANSGLTVGESNGASGELHVSNDATINAGLLQVGRSLFTDAGGAANGLLTITGDQAAVTTGFLSMGYTVDFDEAGVLTSTETNGEGTLSFTSASSVSPITVLEDVYLNDGSTAGFANLEVDLETNPAPAGNVLLIDVGGNLFGTFANLAEGDPVPNSGGRTITYFGGDGNDIYLLDGSAPPTGDFDGNMIYECNDVDQLVAEIAAGTNNLAFNMNDDMVVNEEDLTVWLATAGAGTPGIPGLTASGNPVLPGDANLDGTVDGPDFLVWNTNKFSDGNGWCGGDFNADGTTDGPDFLIWNTNKFQTADGVAAVPEPSSGLLLVLLSLTAFSSRRR